LSDVLVVGGVFREVLDADSTPRHRYGGSGLTAAVAAAQLGAATVLAGAVGAEDQEAVRALVAAAGVTDALQTVPGHAGRSRSRHVETTEPRGRSIGPPRERRAKSPAYRRRK
jgi:sugar/nucleoside kinase (ribokinase family)